MMPNTQDARFVLLPVTDNQWEDGLYDTDDREERTSVRSPGDDEESEDGDIYIMADKAIPTARKGDWTGPYRDQRSAFLIIGALRTEGLLV